MLELCRKSLCAVLIPALMVFSVAQRASAAMIPSDVDGKSAVSASSKLTPATEAKVYGVLRQAGFSDAQAQAKIQSLGPVEVAQLERADLSQKGGEATWVVVLAVVGALALLSWLFHGGANADDDVDVDIDD